MQPDDGTKRKPRISMKKRRMADFTVREIYRFIKSRNESKNIRCVVKMFILVYIFFYPILVSMNSVQCFSGVTISTFAQRSVLDKCAKQTDCVYITYMISSIAVLQTRKINLCIFYLNTLDCGRQRLYSILLLMLPQKKKML